MYVQYGNTTLRVIDLQRFERVNIYTPDNTELLYVRKTLGFSTEFSPGGLPKMPSASQISPHVAETFSGADPTSTKLTTNPRGETIGGSYLNAPSLEDDVGGNSQAPPTAWRSGPETDGEISSRLMIPRQRLILWAYDRQTGAPIRWLESPRPGMTVDCTTGPLPLSCDVISVKGEPNSVGIYFQIQTDMSPCPTGADRFVLSHRWTMTHTYDEDYYLTRITSGEIIFHAGVRERISTNPDSVRNQFILPIPTGFRREIKEITASSDGCTIRYVVADTDPTICFSPGDSGATQMSIVETSQYTQPLIGGINTGGTAPGTPTAPPYAGSEEFGGIIDKIDKKLGAPAGEKGPLRKEMDRPGISGFFNGLLNGALGE